jgi:hypothetical protein
MRDDLHTADDHGGVNINSGASEREAVAAELCGAESSG